MKKFMLKFIIFTLLTVGILPFTANANAKTLKLAYIADDINLPIWEKNVSFLKSYAGTKDVSLTVVSANKGQNTPSKIRSTTQLKYVKSFIDNGYSAIAITASDSYDIRFIPLLAEAHKKGVKIICYDRLINNAYVDTLVTFDNVKVGVLQSETLLKARPNGNYYLLGGGPLDNNAMYFRVGQYFTLLPSIKQNKIKIVGHNWTQGWDKELGYKIFKEFLKTHHNIDAVVASNDGLAESSIKALREAGIKHVVVSGQDAELSAVKRIINGQQLMTIFKSPRSLSHDVLNTAIKLTNGADHVGNKITFNGKFYVHTEALTPIVIKRNNIQVLINDGIYTNEQIYN